MGSSIAVLAYLGPETMLPMASVVAGVAGVLMMFGRNSVAWVKRACRIAVGRARGRTSSAPKPSRRIGDGPVGGIVRDEASRSEAEARLGD